MSTTEEIIEEFQEIHKNKYDYSLVQYKGATTKVDIICPIHGVFKPAPIQHKSGHRCPGCKESKGESIIRQYLDNKNIQYIQEYFFQEGEKNSQGHRFDFYLPNINKFIEFQGIQHYKPVEYFGGIEAFERLRYRDLGKLLIAVCEFDSAEVIEVPFYYTDQIHEYLDYKLGINNG